ncbi:hypothetical protein ACVBEQ_24985 [Nakamurella sp. GG22]
MSHEVPVRSAVFDEPNPVSHAGLFPAMGLAAKAGVIDLTDRHLTVPGGPGHAAGLTGPGRPGRYRLSQISLPATKIR